MSAAFEPLALSPRDAATALAVSRRTITNLIRAGKLIARKLGKRTLVDYESVKAHYATLPPITGPRLLFGERAHVRPRPRRKARRRKRNGPAFQQQPHSPPDHASRPSLTRKYTIASEPTPSIHHAPTSH